MELIFLGNKYVKSNTIDKKPILQLKYQGKRYEANNNDDPSRSVGDRVAMIYRGVTYIK